MNDVIPSSAGGTLPPVGADASEVADALVAIAAVMRAAGLPAPLAVRARDDDHVHVLVAPDDFDGWHRAVGAQNPAATRGLDEPAIRVHAAAAVEGVPVVLESAGSAAAVVGALRRCAAGS